MKLSLLLVATAVASVALAAPAAAQDLGALGLGLTPPPGWTMSVHPDGTTVSIVQDAADAGRTEPAGPRIRVYTARTSDATASASWRVSGDPFETKIGGSGAVVITVDVGTMRRRIVTAISASGRSYRFDLEAPLSVWDAAAPVMERTLTNVRFLTPAVVAQSSGSSTTLPVINPGTAPTPARQPVASTPATSVQMAPTNDRVPATSVQMAPANDRVPVTSVQTGSCDISGRWQMNTANVGTSVWTFTLRPDGFYAGQESGQGGAVGTVTVIGRDFWLAWNTGAGGWAGYVTLTLDPSCAVGTGQHVFQQGRGGFESTTWQRLESSPTQASAFQSGVSASAPMQQACDISGRWQMNTTNVGTSLWTFTRRPDGLYTGQESGQGSATGTATVIGMDFRLDWNTGAGGWAGYVTLTLDRNCGFGSGRHVFERGRGGSEATSWERR